MAEDEMASPSRESDPPSIDFDEDAISSLLDAFVETQTATIAKRTSRPPDPSDSGALAAQRTVFQRTTRPETLPLVGDSHAPRARRIELLEGLAKRSVGSTRARLLTAAGELCEQIGDYEAAVRNYGQAVESDARDVVVLRALRRLAIRERNWSDAAAALEKEAALDLGAAERASALKLLACIQLSKLADSAAAEQAAAHASDLQPGDFVAQVLLASARIARGDAGRGAEALTAAADCWPEIEAQALLLLHAGELFEEVAEHEAARARYKRVLELRPGSLAAHLGLARTSRGLREDEAAWPALVEAEAHCQGPIAEGFRRTAAAIAHRSGSPEAAVSLLLDAASPAARWTLAEAATSSGDETQAIAALQGLAQLATDEVRAVAAARRARLHAARGERTEHEQASAEAAHDSRWAAYVQASGRLLERDSTHEDLPLVLEAVTPQDESSSTRMARSDDIARRADAAELLAAFDRETEAAPESLVAGAALAAAEIATRSGSLDRRAALLRAEEQAPGSLLIGRALLLHDDDATLNAVRWENEAKSTEGYRRSFAYTMAARHAEPSSESATANIDAALAATPSYRPALWELEDRLGPDEARARSAAAQAKLDPDDALACTLRASNWAPSRDQRLAHAEAAFDEAAPEPLLLERLYRASGATEAAGELMESIAARSKNPSALERAAAIYRACGAPRKAAKVLRQASAIEPDDIMLRVQRKDAELRASEFARLAGETMSRARGATDEAERLGAFSAMAEVDRLARNDMQSARLSLQSIAEAEPDHIPTARALEWDALRENDTERMRSSARRLLEALPADSPERLARHRLSLELLRTDSDILQGDLDRPLLAIDDALEADPGLARQVLGAAYAKGANELSLQSLLALQSALEDELERGSLALEAAQVLQGMGAPENALEVLDAAHGHPLAREVEAGLLRAAGRWEDAVAVYQDAASQAKDSHRAASLWRESSCILEEELEDKDRAIEALVAAARCDIQYPDVYRRLAALYKNRGQHEELAALTDARIDAGADTPTLVGLLIQKARQRRERGDLEGVTDALRECLELDPLHFAALTELVDAQRTAGDWQGAAEGLIRIARLKRSTDEQIWAFTQLASLYDVHLQDLPRAEASLRRVIQLAPAHVETLDQLASVMSRQGKALEAGRILEQLVRHASNPVERRDYRIRLAAAVESAGQPREAELVLEQLRSEQPTDVDAILALADYYERQGAGPAEAMHLNRALSDLRNAIDSNPGDELLWTSLVRVLHRRHGPSAASCAASAAIALGHPSSLFEGDVTNRDEALGEPRLPLSTMIDDTVAPEGLPQTGRRLLGLCEHAFDKVLPFDTGAWRLRRPSGEHRSLVDEAGLVAEALGISEPRLRVTYVAPAACMPVSGDPPTIVVGGNLHQLTNPRERVFLFARALKVAGTHLAPALRARPLDLDEALAALLQGHQVSRAQGEATREMLDLRKKLLRAVPRRSRDEVDGLALELRGNREFSTREVPFAIAELGNRAALTLTGDVTSAVDALLKIAGHDVPLGDEGRLSAIRETPEAWAMVRFAISDAHFEARAQAGVDP
ncbi:MAG: hypothetical protein ACN4G0_06825 [Polyangiales bacterium]